LGFTAAIGDRAGVCSFIGRTFRRMIKVKHIAAILAASIVMGLVTPGTAQQQAAEHVRGRAYLFYGLIAAIDWGMDELAQRINRSGVLATTNSHMSWRSVADQAINDYRHDPKPIAVVGHSIGGDSAVQFAEALEAAHVPVSLLVTYDPTRAAGRIPANVERYINLFQSSNILGGGDLAPGHGFHGNYASYNLKDRTEIIHVNLDKFSRIQELLAAKIRSMSLRGEGEAVPLHIVFAATGPIELWDSGTPISAHAGDTLQSLATEYHVPLWALAQVNQKSESTALTEGERVVMPRYLGQKFGPRPAANEAGKPATSDTPNAASTEAPKPAASETPSATSSEAPKPTTSDTPGAASSKTAKPSASDVPSAAATEAPKPTTSDTPSAAATEAPKPTTNVAPSAAATDAPKPAASDTPSAATSDAPEPAATAATIKN
jgi:thioesterase domain-containing protein